MNTNEEKLAHWWAEFVLRSREYDVLIRNLYVRARKYDENEFDGVGIKFNDNKPNDNVVLEDVEFKFAENGKEAYAERKLGAQIEKIKKFSGFNSILGASNSELVVKKLPKWAGGVRVDAPGSGFCSGEVVRDPSPLIPNPKHRENILKVVRQIFETIGINEGPSIFVKCKNKKCRFYYCFSANQPLPIMFNDLGHSNFCPESKLLGQRYSFMKKNFTYDGRTYNVARVNSMSDVKK